MTEPTPWVDPEWAAFSQHLKSQGLVAPNPATASIAEVREAQNRIGRFLNEGSQPLQHERDLQLPGPHGDIPARLYRPDGVDGAQARPPLLIYFHGGGFSQGVLDSWDSTLRQLVRSAGAAVLSVDYRLSPEHRFPVAYDEALAVARLALSDAAGLEIDPARIALGGDSSGANLALAAAAALRDAGDTPALRLLLLFYGVFSLDSESPSWQRLGTGTYGLSQTHMRGIWARYLGDASRADTNDWRIAPLHADMAGMPATWLAVGSLDPLMDDNTLLAQRMQAAGSACWLQTCPGLPHGFIRQWAHVPVVARALNDAAQALQRGLA